MKRCQTSIWELEVNPKLRLRLHLWPRKDTHASKQGKSQLHKVTVSGDAADQLAPSVSDSCVSTSKSVSSSPRTFE